MAHNLAITLFILAVYVAAMATPVVNAIKSSANTIANEQEATKEGDATANALEATTKGSTKDYKAHAKVDAPTKAPNAATKGSSKDHKGSSKDHKAEAKGDAPAKVPEAATKGSAKVPKAKAKGAAVEGPGAPMSSPDGEPEFVEMVIKNPFFRTTPPANDGLPIDPTPEGSMT